MKKSVEKSGAAKVKAEPLKTTEWEKYFIIAGDDGTLYKLSAEDLQAHKMDPSHPAHEHAPKLEAANRLVPISERAAAVEKNTGGSQSLSDFLTKVGWA
jgi:hypothetical protein